MVSFPPVSPPEPEYYTNNLFRSLVSFFQITGETPVSQLMEKGLGRQKVSWLNLRYYPQIRLERQKKVTKHEISVIVAGLLAQIWNPAHPNKYSLLNRQLNYKDVSELSKAWSFRTSKVET